MKVLVIGLGTVGYPTAMYLGRFFDVYGYDIKMDIEGKGFKIVGHFNSLEPDAYVICVPTDQVRDVCKPIAREKKLILIESTMKIGECRRIANDFDIKLLAHCPHRYWEESPMNHGVKQPRVLGALNKESLEFARQFYSKAEIPLHIVSSLEIAEASKLVENANRFVNIALAEEVKMLCDKLGLDFKEVREACNTKWNISLLEARDGIKGKCLGQDIGSLITLARGKCGDWIFLTSQMHLMEGAVKADEKYKRQVP